MKEESTPKAPAARNFFSPELLPPAAIADEPNVVEEVERKMLPNFCDHRRSPELVTGCRRRCPEKMFLVGKNYFNHSHHSRIQSDFLNMKKRDNEGVIEFEQRFTTLSYHVPHLIPDERTRIGGLIVLGLEISVVPVKDHLRRLLHRPLLDLQRAVAVVGDRVMVLGAEIEGISRDPPRAS
ncbi:hypothetical protein ACLB2K_062152 [Fragaria x ananassa]